MSRTAHLIWAATKSLTGSTTCPACGSNTRTVHRKYLVTTLRECPRCFLRFRFPKDEPDATRKFYEDEVYNQATATELPSESQLQKLIETKFAGIPEDYTRRIEIMRAAGVQPGARVLDFGSSWGYGSWQMKQAGFEVFSVEIGSVRRLYAQDKLGCVMVQDLQELAGSIDCFISSHVIEHLTDPRILFAAAELVLKPSGTLIVFCPNGALQRERIDPVHYHLNWGLVHPLMITPEFMKLEVRDRGFARCHVYSDAKADQVAARSDGPLEGVELLTVAWRGEC